MELERNPLGYHLDFRANYLNISILVLTFIIQLRM
jgi:hypothetical protein